MPWFGVAPGRACVSAVRRPGCALVFASAMSACGPAPTPPKVEVALGSSKPHAEAAPAAVATEGWSKSAERVIDVGPGPASVVHAFAGTVPAACWGAQLDLAKLGDCRCQQSLPSPAGTIRASAGCGDAHAPIDLKRVTRVELIPSRPRVVAGESVELLLRILNTSDEAVALVFRTPFHAGWLGISSVTIRVLDAKGVDVTTSPNSVCGQGGSQGGGSNLMALAPRGKAELSFGWNASAEASKRSAAGDCEFYREKLLPGKYTLRAHFPWFENALAGPEWPTASIEVVAPP